ncbi:MAG: terminase small subunit [Aquabacterium sp.]|nr:terminase small subunit [Aquabacterium sp.]MBP8190343.1 terminase small subunit [Aquabacterium sp.]
MAAKKTAKPVAPKTKASSSKQAAADRRHAFVEAYITNGGNATQAALTAGFAPKSAYSQGHNLLKHHETIRMLEERRKNLAQKYELTTENVLKSLAQAVHFDPRRLYNADGSLKPVHELDEDTAMALSGFEVIEMGARKDEDAPIGVTKKVKWLDKNAARDQAMKHLGLFEKDNSQANPLGDVPREALKALVLKLGGGLGRH